MAELLQPKLRFKEFSKDLRLNILREIFETVTDYVAAGSFKSLKDNVKVCSEKYLLLYHQ